MYGGECGIMNIILYKITDPKIKLVKSLGTGKSIAVQIKNPTNFLNPEFTVQKSDVIDYNYMYVESFKRYYFYDPPSTQNSDIVTIKGNVDALMTYQSQIKNTGAIVERQQNLYNLYLADSQVPDYAYKRVQTKIFPNNVINTNQQFVLITNGR